MAMTSAQSDESSPRAFYSTQEFADIIGVSRGKIYDLIDCGGLASLKLGGRRLIPAHEVDRLTGLAGYRSFRGEDLTDEAH